jgi:hypothetical protein
VADEQGQTPEGSEQPAGQNPPAAEAQTFSADYVKSLREEAKEARLSNKQLAKELDALKAAAGDNSALTAKIDEMNSTLAKAQAEATAATQRAELVRLAAKANVPIELAEMLDLSKLDLTDEKKALEQLGKLASTKPAPTQAKPGTWMSTGKTDAELRNELFGARKTSIFGG